MKNLPLKIQKKQALNIGLPISDSPCIELIEEDVFNHAKFLNHQALVKENISSIFEEFGEDYRFHYRIELFERNERDVKFVCGELGIACLEKQKDKILLHRISPRVFQENGKESKIISSPQREISDHPDHVMLVSSYFPENIFDCMLDPHALIYSDENFPFNTLVIEENSLVGREFGKITNISLSSLFDTLIKKLESTKKKISLKAKQLVLDGSAKPSNIEGNLIYDKKLKVLKYFDGQSWKTLAHNNENT